jgi:chromosome partitioning protein
VSTKTITVANQKGGVGKTTTAVSVAACLAEAGREVLLLDLDPQANATSGLGLEKTAGASAYAPLLGQGKLEDKILASAYDRLSVIPSEVDLCGAEIELMRVEEPVQSLKRLLAPIHQSGRFEVVLIDCPPSLSVLTMNAFAAAEHLLVPLQCEYYALEGVATINRLLTQLRESGANPGLNLLGVVMTMFDARTRLSHQVVEEVRRHFGDQVFETVIPRTTRLAEAPSHGKPIVHYDPYSSATAAYQVLTGEIISRLKI